MFNFHVDELRHATSDMVSRDARIDRKAAPIGTFNTWLEHSVEDLFESQAFDREAARISIENARALCIEKHQLAQQNGAKLTLAVVAFRSLEKRCVQFSC